jgi:hypothetical protein
LPNGLLKNTSTSREASLEKKPESELFSEGGRIMCSYEHFKSSVFISHPGGEGSSGTQKRQATQRNKDGTQKKLENVYSHLDDK